MPNADGTGNWIDGLKHVGVAAVGFVIIYLTGQYLPNVFLVIIPPAVCAIGAYLATMGSDAKTVRQAVIAWGVIGLAAGIGFWIAQ